MWRLVIPVAIAILPLSLAAQNGARTPDDGAWLDKDVKNPQKPEQKKMTTDQALVVR